MIFYNHIPNSNSIFWYNAGEGDAEYYSSSSTDVQMFLKCLNQSYVCVWAKALLLNVCINILCFCGCFTKFKTKLDTGTLFSWIGYCNHKQMWQYKGTCQQQASPHVSILLGYWLTQGVFCCYYRHLVVLAFVCKLKLLVYHFQNLQTEKFGVHLRSTTWGWSESSETCCGIYNIAKNN